jgi:uncharacterized membrane protein
MNLRPMLICNTLLIAGMAAFTAWAYGIDGTPDRFGSKEEALLIMPAVALGITLLFWILPRIDPRRSNIESNGKFWNAIAIGVVALMVFIQTLMILSATGHPINITNYMLPGLSALFIVIGNYMSKTRSNWFGGIRTPWTLSSDYSWSKTHRAGGALFMLSGLVSLAAWAVLDIKLAFFTLIGSVIAASLLSVVLSYWYWRQDPART